MHVSVLGAQKYVKAILDGHSQGRVAMALSTALQKDFPIITKRCGHWPALVDFNVLFKLTGAGQ